RPARGMGLRDAGDGRAAPGDHAARRRGRGQGRRTLPRPPGRRAAMTAPVVAVVPAYNEEEAIEGVVRGLAPLPVGREVGVVDDGSRDRTGERARAAGAVVLRPAFNLGIGGAVQTGFLWAVRRGARAAIQVDGDGQHPAEEVPRVLAPVLEGRADVAI